MLIRAYDLKCDGCGDLMLILCVSPKDTRKEARKRGWARVVSSRGRGSKDGRDLCPACAGKAKL